MTLSEFERQRQANIERNKKLLNNLNISALSGDISNHISTATVIKEKKTKPRQPKVKKEVVPVRRSRRLAGEGLEEDGQVLEKDLVEAERRINNDYKDLKETQIIGTLSLADLMKQEGEDSIKNILHKSSNKISAGDYYDIIIKNETTKDIQILREEYSKMKIYDQWHAKDLKITPERVQTITFHPSAQNKLILAGDTTGHLGIFNANNKEDIDIINFQIHSKNISHIEFNYNDLNKVYTGSSDSKIRLIDMEKFQSDEFFIDSTNEGITDLKIHGNEMFYSTKNGEFGKIDIRSPAKNSIVLRLANNKIGGIAINPLDSNIIATGSLDRTLKLWDLRFLMDCEWNKYDDNLQTAGNFAIYDSKLSVSYVDWNRSNDLVCNGYDNTIRLFNNKIPLGYSSVPSILEPTKTIQHNCQTGRWVSILKARWQRFGNDGYEKFSIGNMSKFIDIYDNLGNQLAHLSDPTMTTVPAACNLHPTENWVVGAGSSSKVYLYY